MPAEVVCAHPNPTVSVIIPSLDGDRGGNVGRLVDDLGRQTLRDIEIILSVGERPNGHARNVGASIARGSYLAFFDDDVILGDEHVLRNMIGAIERTPGLGLVGTSQLCPPGSTWKQRWLARDLARGEFPVVDVLTETDMATHAGMALSRDVWEEVGGESDTLVTGTDSDLRHRLRSRGLRVAVAPRVWVFHPQPDSITRVLRRAWVHGRYQVEYRQVHPEPVGFLPFTFLDSPWALLKHVAIECLVLPVHVFITDRRLTPGFTPIRALHRWLMAMGYAYEWLALGRKTPA